MTYVPPLPSLNIDRKNLTIMGVLFPDIETLEEFESCIASNMYEGFIPTPKLIEITRDYFLDKITTKELTQKLKEN